MEQIWNKKYICSKSEIKKYVWSKSEYATFTSGIPIFKNRLNMLNLIKLRKSRRMAILGN